MSRKLRVLVIAHGHPDFSRGGAEHAAHHLFEALNRRDDAEAWFIGRNGNRGLSHTGTPFALRPGGREFLFTGDAVHFDFSSTWPRHIWRDFVELLHNIKPDVVHFHHYVHLGIEMIRAVKLALPEARIVLTLHEYLGICNRNGQMIKSNGQLCYESSPAECHVCMPERSPQDFFLRELYIKSFFKLVDRFVSPSHFLKQRYIDWGIPAERIDVFENGLPNAETPAPPPEPRARRDRFAYFGQLTPFKGIEVLLDGFARLPKAVRKQARLEVHGGGLHHFEQSFQDRIHEKLEDGPDSIRYYGAYAPEDMGQLIARVDWVIMPSTWWENSPLVIQEAFRFGKPVICSGIGGMAEKVIDGVSGLHFRVGNAEDLSEVLLRAIETEGLWDKLHAGLPRPPSDNEFAASHMGIYRELGAGDTKAERVESSAAQI